jgi:hypothetical protein
VRRIWEKGRKKNQSKNWLAPTVKYFMNLGVLAYNAGLPWYQKSQPRKKKS